MSPNWTPEQWSEVARLFDAALELPEEERAAARQPDAPAHHPPLPAP